MLTIATIIIKTFNEFIKVGEIKREDCYILQLNNEKAFKMIVDTFKNDDTMNVLFC